MSNIKNIIALTGFAGVGKDTICEHLIKQLNPVNFHRIAFADKLKAECRELALSLYGIDINNCSFEDKTKIRPFLIGHGATRRNLTNGKYWIDAVDKNHENCILTDLRFFEREEDEDHWVKSHKNSIIVYLHRRNIFAANELEDDNYRVMMSKNRCDIVFELTDGEPALDAARLVSEMSSFLLTCK